MPPRAAALYKERRKLAAQRCLCGHRRDVHNYQSIGYAKDRAPNARPCKVQNCGCPSFILLQRSIL